LPTCRSVSAATSFSVAARHAFSVLRARSGLSQDGTDEGYEHSSISTIRRNKSSTGGDIWIRGDFVRLFLFCYRASFFARFTPLRVLMFCRRISELYCALEWSGASRCTPTAGIRMQMPYFSEICPLRGTLLKPHKFNFDAPTRPIFSNAS